VARAPQFSKLGEDKLHGFLNMFVRILFDLARLAPAEAWRKHEAKLATLRLGVARGEAALAHQAELIFRHRSFQPQ